MSPESANRLRHQAEASAGHYESYFIRANAPQSALAFWIRYTIFSPAGRPHGAQGELWAIVFDGGRQQHVAVKQAWPLSACRFDAGHRLAAELPSARLSASDAQGSCSANGRRIGWSLTFAAGQAPLLLLPEALYEGGFPKAKSLVPHPLARFDGTLHVDGERIDVRGWLGSQNHNWGRQHTDRYAWGQVAGFDDGHDESFLEVASAKLKFGPLWTPWITPIVLRHRGREHRLNALGRSLRAHASVQGFDWRFQSRGDGVHLQGRIHAERADFVGLRYANPPGGIKQCLNSKIAHAELTLQHADGARETLTSRHRAAFELLGDADDHGVAMSC